VTARAQRGLALAAAAALSCAHARSYADPDPARVATALVVIEIGSSPSGSTDAPSASLHVYEGPECPPTYRGTVNVSTTRRPILVRADRTAFVQVSVSDPERAACDASAGWVPEPGGRYRLAVRSEPGRACAVSVTEQSGAPVPVVADPATCAEP
jgi:hypothetical protein